MSVDAGLDFLKSQTGQIPIRVPDVSIVRTLCSLVLAHLNIVSENGGFGTFDDLPYNYRIMSNRLTTDSSNSNFFSGDLAEAVASVSNAEDPGAAKNKTVLQRHPAQLPSFLSKMFLFCFITAFGSVLEGIFRSYKTYN